MERELIVERTRACLEVARQLGRTGGRKRQRTETEVKKAAGQRFALEENNQLG